MVQVAERNDQYFGKEDHNTVVTITDGGVLASNTGSEYLQLEFEADGKEGDTGYNNYITPKALPYTAQRVQSILSHNAKDEAEKTKLAKELAELPDDEFADWAVKNLVGKKAYLHISYSDNINPKNGLPYLQKNVAGYEVAAPKESVKQVMGGGEEITKENLSDLPF